MTLGATTIFQMNMLGMKNGATVLLAVGLLMERIFAKILNATIYKPFRHFGEYAGV